MRKKNRRFIPSRMSCWFQHSFTIILGVSSIASRPTTSSLRTTGFHRRFIWTKQRKRGAAVLDAINDAVKQLDRVPPNRKRVMLLISETRDHGSQSAIDDVIKAIGNSNIVVYALAFSPSKSNVLDTLRGNNNWDLHPEQTEMHPNPDLLAPFVLAAQAMRKNAAKAIAAQSGGEYEMFSSGKGFDAEMTNFSNHLHSRYLLSFEPSRPHPGLHKLSVKIKAPQDATALARTSYWAVGQQR